MKKIFTSIIILSLIIFNHAQAQTEEATSSEITIEKKVKKEENTAQILQNLERLAQDSPQKEQIKEQYQDATLRPRGFIAQIVQLRDDTFKILTLDQKELFITPDKSTTIVKKGQSTTGENYTLTDWFAIDDWLVLIGVQNGDIFQPRRILISSESLAPVETFVYRGTIKDLRKDKVDLTFLGQEEVQSFKIDKSINLVDTHNETVAIADLTPDTPIIAIGTKKSDSLQLQTLRLL